MTDAEAGGGAEGGQQGGTQAGSQQRGNAQVALEEQRQQGADHRRPHEAEFAQHVAVGNAGGTGFTLGKALAEHHQPVEENRDQKERNLDLPIDCLGGGAARHKKAGQASQDESARPAGVEDIEVVGLFAGEERGHQRIDHRFRDAIADGEEKHAPEEALECQRLSTRCEGGAGGQREGG